MFASVQAQMRAMQRARGPLHAMPLFVLLVSYSVADGRTHARLSWIG